MTTPILDLIKEANDIKKIREEDWGDLAQEIRDFLINKIVLVILLEFLGGFIGTLFALSLDLNITPKAVMIGS